MVEGRKIAFIAKFMRYASLSKTRAAVTLPAPRNMPIAGQGQARTAYCQPSSQVRDAVLLVSIRNVGIPGS
jgi:hypothetical protein